MENDFSNTKEYALESIITASVKVPGVKVNRNGFLSEAFASTDYDIQQIIAVGPIEVGVTRDELAKISSKWILKRTGQSSVASFVAGIPGGTAMAATIPMDILQFFGMAIRLAQELSYLYGAEDLWKNGEIDDEKIKSQLIMYCGVMFGVSGAVSGVRVISSQLAKTTLKSIPQKALTKTFWYPMIKKIGKALSVKVTKATIAKGVSKAVPIIGGVVSGSLNFASMMPMANRLQKALDKACFDYTDADMDADIDNIENSIIYEDTDKKFSFGDEANAVKEKLSTGFKTVSAGISGILSKKSNKADDSKGDDDIFETIEKLSKLKDMGAITAEEFEVKKSELLSKI